MLSRSWRFSLVAVIGALVLSACDASLTEAPPHLHSQLDRIGAGSMPEAVFDESVVAALKGHVDALNARLADAGSDLRVGYPWMFMVGGGTDPFARLRTGVRWQITSPTYILDESDYTEDLAAADAESALAASYEAWNAVVRTYIETGRIPDPGTNLDILDGTIVADQCINVVDFTSSILDLGTGLITPEAHIVMGGWLSRDYFELCLGSESILGVTWFLYGPDADGDQYLDLLYVEQFYNDEFEWVVEGSQFLVSASGVDLQSIATHENGHALGLDHFGGPVRLQPFTLKPNGRIFNPEAVMNPFYPGGEKRHLLPTDIGGLSTLYSALR